MERLLAVTWEGRLEHCPLCGHAVEMILRTTHEVGHRSVVCTNDGPIGPLEAPCPLYFPPEEFYQATKHEAAAFWNAYVLATKAQQEQPAS